MLNLNVGSSGERHQKKYRDESGVSSIRESATPKPKASEAKAAAAFVKATNVLAFDPAVFAFIISMEDIAIQKRALASLIALIDIVSYKFDIGAYEKDSEIEFAMAAKRALDAMAVFREKGMLG